MAHPQAQPRSHPHLMKQKQITKNQHYVPECYLKQFAIENPNQGFMVRAFDVRAVRILERPFSTAQICWKKFFYAVETGVRDDISQALETVFGRIENVFSTALPGIINRAAAQQLTFNDLDFLAYFMSVQWVRTPSFREWLQKVYSDYMKWRINVRASRPEFRDFIRSTADDMGEDQLSDEQIEEIKQRVQSSEYDVRWDNSPHLNFIDEQKVNGFHNLFLEKKWRIHLSQGPYHFITSDNPVVHWKPPMTGLVPVTFMDGSHLFALTPKILIETTRPGTMDPAQRPIDRLFYSTDTDKGSLAFIFNRVIACQAHQYAYAPQTSEFERILTAI